MLQAATTITQTFNQSESTLTENFTQSTGGDPAMPFTWNATGGIGGTGRIEIPVGSDQIWTSKQKYSVVDNGIYQVKALFRTSGTGYGSLGLTTASQSDADGVFGSPNEESIGVLFHGGAGNWINHTTVAATQNASDLGWAGNVDLGTTGTWYLFDLIIEDLASADQYKLTLTIHNVDQSSGVITGVFSGQSYTTTVTNTAIKNASDLYVFFGAQDDRMDSIDNFEVEVSDNVTITGQQAGGNAKYALNFDETGDYVSTSNYPISNNNQFTIEAWMKTTSNLDAKNIVGLGRNSTDIDHIQIRTTGGEFALWIRDHGQGGSVSSGTAVNDGKWHHVAVSKDGSTYKLYVDGELKTNVLANTDPSLLFPVLDTFTIGAMNRNGTYEYEFDGSIDEVRVWEDVRTQSEIQTNFNNELVGDEENLVAYYKFNDGAGSFAEDSQTNGTKTYGALNGDTAWAKLGDKRLDFDGMDDNVLITDFPAITSTSFTQSVWVYPTENDSGDYQGIFGFEPVSGLHIRQPGIWQRGLNIAYGFGDGVNYGNNAAETNNDPLTLNAWNHIVTTYDGANYKLYVNGVEAWSVSATGTPNPGAGMRLGYIDDGSIAAQYFQGKMAEAAFFLRDMDASEVSALYNKKLTGNKNNLIGYWPLDGNDTSAIAFDKSAYENNGVITGASPVTNTLNLTTISTNEETTSVFDFDTFNTTENWGITYSITGGTDSALFAIVSTTGKLSFLDIANATEGSSYAVEITATGSGENVVNTYTINVVDASINTAPTLTTATTINTQEGLDDVQTAIQATDESITNSAINFDGVDDHVVLSNETAFDFTSEITLQVWMKSSAAADTWDGMITKGDGAWRLHRTSGANTINFATNQGASVISIDSTTDVFDGKWHQITATFDGTDLKIYVDGVVENTLTSVGTIDTNNIAVAIGANLETVPLRYFDGAMNDIRIWNKALSEADIQANINQELNGNEAGLVAYYNFEETSGTDILDSTPNHHNGTLTNATNDATTQTSNSLEYSLGSGNDESSFTINSTTGVLTFNTPPDYEADAPNNSYDVSVSVTDGVLTDSQLYTINVTDYVADSDGDGIQDEDEGYFEVSPTDSDGDGTADYLDTDSDNDGVLDSVEGTTDTNPADGTPDRLQTNAAFVGAGNALSFDGVGSDHVEITGFQAFGSTFTQELWYYPTDAAAHYRSLLGTVVSSGNANDSSPVIIEHQKGILFGFGDGAAWNKLVPNVLTINKWNHIATTFDGTNYKLFVNGIEKFDTTDLSGKSPNSTTIFRISSNTFNGEAAGKIDEVRVWNLARTPAQIRETMARALQGDESGLVGYYPFDEGNGAAARDQSNIAYDGTISGASWIESTAFNTWRGNSTDWNDAVNWSLGRIPIAEDNVGIYSTANDPVISTTSFDMEQSLNFDGIDDFVALTKDTLNITGSEVSISAWVFADTTNNSEIFSKNANSSMAVAVKYGLRYRTDGRVTFQIGDGTNSYRALTTQLLGTGAWHHVAGTYQQGVGIKIYIDGIEVSTTTTSVGTGINTAIGSAAGDGIGIGRYPNTGDAGGGRNYFDGKLDEISVWSKTLSANEVDSIMTRSLAANEVGLEAYYNFNQASGSSLPDESHNANTGTLTNMDGGNDWVASYNDSDLNNLIIGNSTTPLLNSALNVEGNLILESNLDLNGQIITLGSSANLIENNGLLSGASGSIVTTRDLSNISAENVANLGATITSTENMGSTTITRSHTPSGNPTGISRQFDISPTNNSALNASLTIDYNDSELNGLSELDLALYKSENAGITWYEQSGYQLDTVNNQLTLTSVDSFSSWTAAKSGYVTPILYYNFDNNDKDHSGNNNHGAELNYRLTERTQVYLTAQHFSLARDDNNAFGLGLRYYFGDDNGASTPTKKMPTIAAPVTVDHDNDGVVDSVDQCPNSDSRYLVDDSGCTLLAQQYVNFSLVIHYANDSFSIAPSYDEKIMALADFIKTNQVKKLVVYGHTSALGAAQYNQSLSLRRANHVRAILAAKFGISVSTSTAIGQGESKLKVNENTEQAHQQNRRIELNIDEHVLLPVLK
mgnify:CR=1 FL=1